MSDIFGRSTSRPPVITKQKLTSMIKRYLASRLNLVDVDPGEIVVFETDNGKLKTSNLSLSDILTKSPTAKDNSIVVFKAGKLDADIPITDLTNKFDKIAEVETDLDTHMKDYKQFRRNVIAKFFGSPLVVTPSLTEIKKSIDDLTNLKIIIDGIKKDIIDIKTIADKVKIPHEAGKIKGLSYVVVQKIDVEYRSDEGARSGTLGEIILLETITGIYRISIFSEHQFNITASIGGDENNRFFSKGVNTTLIALKNPPSPDTTGGNFYIRVTPVDPVVLRTKYSYIVEYLSPI